MHMIIRILIAFVIFAGLAYYFNIDVRNLVDKSGVPTWLTEHGIKTSATSSSVTATSTSQKL